MPTLQPHPLTEDQAAAVRRWKLGHHSFHVQLVAMNTVLAEVVDALRARSGSELAERLNALAPLYDAGTASMRYAASFDASSYECLIRPSMAEPFLSPGFSGLLNRDHATMLETLTWLRREMKKLVDEPDVPDRVREASLRLWAAQARNRRHHMLVCRRFVPDGVSLLQQHFAASDADSAHPWEDMAHADRD